MKIEDQNKEGLSILLVEDNFLNQKITTYNLRKYNHKVSIANNGLEAVNLFKEKKFDLILMDIMMPVIRKIEKAHKLSEYTPIIAVTANTLDNDREKCLSWGMDEFIAKPFDMNQLNEILLSLKIV